jgi:hypothetical protein
MVMLLTMLAHVSIEHCTIIDQYETLSINDDTINDELIVQIEHNQ